MEKVDFTSNDFIFMAKPEQYYIEGHPVQCDGDYTEWKPNKIVESGWGMFNGLTMVSYRGYSGELPRMDGDTASFDEFNIYYKGTLVNKMTYEGLYNMITRDSQLNKIL
jgi:hypothetical protein